MSIYSILLQAAVALAFQVATPFAVADEATPAQDAEPTPSVSESPAPSEPQKKPKGRVAREKEAEGTQAPNRFDADIIFKSKYELNGKPLEVDTD